MNTLPAHFKQFGRLCLWLLIGCGLPVAAMAGSNSLSKHEVVDDVGFYDLVVSLDWIPSESDKTGRLTTAFERFARDVHTMSEGRQKLRKLYVYTNKAQMNTADIRLLDSGGRSNAHANGFGDQGGRILSYTAFSSGSARTATYIGHTLAHEFAHYVLGLYDEYAGSASSSSRPSVPLSGDNPRPSIMNAQGQAQWWTIAGDYDEVSEQKTAHWRVFESSGWETVVRAPTDDSLPEQFSHAFARTRWQEFVGVAAPSVLSKPTTGWDSDFEIIYVSGSVAVLVIDDSGSMNGAPIAAAKGAARQFVDLVNDGQNLAVVGFDSSARVEAPITALNDQTARDAIKLAIDGLSAGGGTNFSAALLTARGVLEATDASVQRYVIMLSDGQASAPNTDYFQQNGIPIYTVGLGDSIGEAVLRQIAGATNGSYSASPTNADLAAIYSEIQRNVAGTEALVVATRSEVTAGATEMRTIPVSDLDEELKLTARSSSVAPSVVLTDPNGMLFTSSSLPPGATYTEGANYVVFRVSSPIPGDWVARVGSNASSTDTLDIEVAARSTLVVDLQVQTSMYPEPVLLLATVNAPEAVTGATVVAVAQLKNSADPAVQLALRDDGLPPDLIADDGVYAGVLAQYDPGEYEFTAIASNDGQGARIHASTVGEAGEDLPPIALAPFVRAANAAVQIQGTVEDRSTPFNALPIATDNSVHWGRITPGANAFWGSFTATQGVEYHIQTSNLISLDGAPMATSLSLFADDTVTLLDNSARRDGSDMSYIVWTAPADARYLVEVLHADNGSGTFGITIGETSRFRVLPDVFGTPSGDSGGSSGGGSSLGFLVMLFGLLGLSLRRAR